MHEKVYQLSFNWILFFIYNLYLIAGVCSTWSTTKSYGEGIKLLVILTCIAYAAKIYQHILQDDFVKPLILEPLSKVLSLVTSNPFLHKFVTPYKWFFVIALFTIYSLYITSSSSYRLVSATGIFAFVLFGYALSEHRGQINWDQVLWGLSLQFSFAVLVLRTESGSDFFKALGERITTFLSFSEVGSIFVFGYLVNGKVNVDPIGNATRFDHFVPVAIHQTVFAFKVLPVILFFSFFVSILYHYGIMQCIVHKVGWLLETMIGTTPAESLNAAANIFLGMTEAPLVIKPYVPTMTKSELFAVMTGGFATIAGAVMAAYINMGVDVKFLLSASVMAAPAALGYSKLFYPETEVTKTDLSESTLSDSHEKNALEAAANGASQAIKICANIAANLIAFLAFIQFLNCCCTWLGSCIDCDFISFEWILSKLFVPIALLMGVEWNDCDEVARLIGLKTVVNEFIAYAELSQLITDKQISKRSVTIATFALCGFSNFSSIGITLGALGSMVPERKSDLASIALKSMIAGTTVTLTSACIAGLLVDV